ncbi:hypothetical protein [Nocardia brasiliensis]|uniref:hypothetical protein n=1 Tax=Nocardia brasiliensis TaxID=37326 RepID=UPI00366B8CC6
MPVQLEWTGLEVRALRDAMRETRLGFCEVAGVRFDTLRKWERRSHTLTLRAVNAAIMDTILARATDEQRDRFRLRCAELRRQPEGIQAAEPGDVRHVELLRTNTGPAVANPHPHLRLHPGDHEPIAASDSETVHSRSNPVSPLAGSTGEPLIRTPAGRYFLGSVTPVVLVPAVLDSGRILAASTDAVALNPILLRPHRSMIVATVNTAEGVSFYGLDRRRARARSHASNPGAPLLIPQAYQLDDFTLGITWAVTNLDDALLDDDAELAAAELRLHTLDCRALSLAGPELAAELSVASQMWLGSQFCARHILDHADQLSDTPFFWTREQRGEEASTWLLFTHKYQYLQSTAATFASTGRTLTRAFCIPPDSVTASRRPERVLLLLTAALIESFGVTVAVCIEPEYTAVQGFVLDRDRRAIIATWINTNRFWHADITDHRPTLHEFSDASEWARTHSILTAPTPLLRLHTLSDYLQLDWTWLTRRARDLADTGTVGLIRPRSRLLSLAGLDKSLRFLADLAREDR